MLIINEIEQFKEDNILFFYKKLEYLEELIYFILNLINYL